MSQRDAHLRKAALEVLLAHPYAADDLLSSSAWQPFCSVLPSLLSDACPETAMSAATFAGSVFREVKRSSPQQLAQLCIALAASVTCPDDACTASVPAWQPGKGSHAGADAAVHATSSADTAGLYRAAAHAAVLKLLVSVLEALPKVWASFRAPLLQQLWDALCPLLRTEAGSRSTFSAEPTAASRPAHANEPEMGCQHTRKPAGTSSTCSAVQLDHPSGKAQSASGSGQTQVSQHRSSAGAGYAAHPLAALCHADAGFGRWWRMWTAPAASAKVLTMD